jgi:hypothetical protein
MKKVLFNLSDINKTLQFYLIVYHKIASAFESLNSFNNGSECLKLLFYNLINSI